MGIERLHTFAKNLAIKVSIEKEISQFRRKHNINKPLIVVDFNAFLHIFIGNDVWEKFYGGRSTKCTSQAEKFCNYIQKCGAKLVFFLEGPIKPEKLEEWTIRRNRSYKDYQKVLTKLYCSTNKILAAEVKWIRFWGTTYDCVQFVIKEKNCGHQISLKNECDLDLCKYATENNAMAVIANDTDFLAMPGDWDVWGLLELENEKFSARRTNKAQLRTALGLSKWQMPIFATFCGNDFISYENILKDFMFTSRMNRFNRHISIAEFIKNNFIEVPDAAVIADCIKKNCNSQLSIDFIQDCVNRSLDFYNCIFKPEKPILGLEWLQEFTRETFMTFVYTVKMKLPFTISHQMIDLNLTEFTPFAQLVLPIVKRKAGIVLADEINKSQKLEIYLKYDHHQDYKKHIESPEYPSFETPSIKILVGKDPSNTISEDVKMEIFSWIIFNDRKILKASYWTKILRDSTEYFLPIVTLYYLIKKNQIKIFEADSVLLSVQKLICAKCDVMKPTKLPKARAAWIAFTYTQLNYFFRNALIISGLGKYLGNEYFDGYVYHPLYNEMDKNIHGRKALITPIETLRLYVNQ